jgi:hypothetical protein
VAAHRRPLPPLLPLAPIDPTGPRAKKLLWLGFINVDTEDEAIERGGHRVQGCRASTSREMEELMKETGPVRSPVAIRHATAKPMAKRAAATANDTTRALGPVAISLRDRELT